MECLQHGEMGPRLRPLAPQARILLSGVLHGIPHPKWDSTQIYSGGDCGAAPVGLDGANGGVSSNGGSVPWALGVSGGGRGAVGGLEGGERLGDSLFRCCLWGGCCADWYEGEPPGHVGLQRPRAMGLRSPAPCAGC